jgi:hypothetical protein
LSMTVGIYLISLSILGHDEVPGGLVWNWLGLGVFARLL